jgi:hypothetical protein
LELIEKKRKEKEQETLVLCTRVNVSPLALSSSWFSMMQLEVFCLTFGRWALMGRQRGRRGT